MLKRLALLAPLVALSFTLPQTVHAEDGIDWVQGLIQVTGSGAPPERGSPAQKRLMAERAAFADGLRQIGEIVNGVHVDSETVVRDFVTESDVIRTQMSAFIKGAQKVGKRYLSDGSVEIDLVVKLYGHGGLAEIIRPEKPRKEPPPPTVTPTPPKANYSGLIVDCRGLGMQPAMSPSILDEAGGEIYIGRRTDVDPDYVVNHGIVGYARTLDDAKANERVGKAPLVVKGKMVKGNFKADVVVTNMDAQAILGMEDLLKGARVVMVM